MSHASDFPGWPNCPPASSLTEIEVDGRKFLLHKTVAPLFEAFLRSIVAGGYRIGTGQLDDWSFVCRPIAGTSKPSNHSRGTAIDINATTNPQSYRLQTDIPDWVVKTAARYGISWGGDYRYPTKADPMHFEYRGTKAEAELLVRTILKRLPPFPSAKQQKLLGYSVFVPSGTPNLRRGMAGVKVLAMQNALKYVTGRIVVPHPAFTAGVEQVVIDFQRFMGLPADGVYGPGTAAALAFCVSNKKQPPK